MDISNAELEVLKVLWQQSPLSAKAVVERLEGTHDWHEKTIRTLLNRLTKKGALHYQKDGRAYLYSPAIPQESYQQKASTTFINRLFSGRVSPLVAGFAKSNHLQQEDIDELKQLIEGWESQQLGDDHD